MKESRLGFTLVELMIVVTLIGLLATIATTAFTKARRRAKSAEAKATLGAIFKGEAAFFAEHGTYGNRIDHLGIDVDSDPTKLSYSTGFPISLQCQQQTEPLPDKVETAAGIKLNKDYPYYYVEPGMVTVLRRIRGDGTPQGRCMSWGFPNDGSSYRAAATGVLRDNLDFTSTSLSLGPNGQYDVWTIDQNGDLIHYSDGT